MTTTVSVPQDRVAALTRTDWLQSAPAHLVEQLTDVCTHLVNRRGDVIYRSGQAADRLFILLNGRVGAWHGESCYFITDTPLTTLCLENVITGISYFAEMRVLSERAEVLAIPSDGLNQLLADHPATGLEIARHIARRLQAFTEQTVDMAILDVTRRLAKYLVRLTGTDGLTKAMKQADLAARMGASRQSINVTLARFADHGWITPVGRGRYRVDDRAALERHAGGSDLPGAERFD